MWLVSLVVVMFTRLHCRKKREIVAFPHQAGGHAAFKCGNRFLKGMQGRSIVIEDNFYATINRLKTSCPTHRALSTFMPRYFGLQVIAGEQYLVLEDLTGAFERPSVADLKIGTKTWQDGASEEKIASKREKFVHQDTYGWRMVGMRVWQPSTQSYKVYGKKYGKSQTVQAMNGGKPLIDFLSCDDQQDSPNLRVDVLLQLQMQLQQILDWFEQQQVYSFRSSSLLIIFEGQVNKTGGAQRIQGEAAGRGRMKVAVKMIDFVYTQPLKEGDHDCSYIHGLRDILRCLNQILSGKRKRRLVDFEQNRLPV
jgi:1D-myo-inositol-tetrakisphosphate 5-kinase/inositol-polyphosphate multikinase